MNWDEYAMSIAEVVAKKSKDPWRKVGACLLRRCMRSIFQTFWMFTREGDGILIATGLMQCIGLTHDKTNLALPCQRILHCTDCID